MRIRLMGILIVVMLVSAAAAFADETKVSLGLKAWHNKFEEETDGQTIDFGSSLMLGPSLNVRFSNNWFVGASYLVTTKDYETEDFVFVGDELSISRDDLDLVAGYMFTPNFGAFFGYKSITADASYTFTSMGINDVDLLSWELTGPGIGVLGKIPLSDVVALYGNLAFMWMDSTVTFTDGSPSESEDLAGASVEAGVAFSFAERMSANIGVKAQSFSGDDDAGVETTDSFSGLTFGANYTF